MTFPAYRHLLSLTPARRHPGEASQRLVQPFGIVARDGDAIVAVALAEAPVRREDGAPELLSLFVQPEIRGRGVATALVEAVERDLAARGHETVEAVYTTGPSTVAIERIFNKRDWAAPVVRTLTVRATLREAIAMPWYGRVGLPRGAELFSWRDLTTGERTRLRTSDERAPWIPEGLRPWQHDANGFEPLSSVGLRWRGEVVGWLINHRTAPDTVRFTCSFMRRDLSRRARILPLYSESIRRLHEAGVERCTFVTPVEFTEMIAFIRQRIAPYVSFTGETRGTRKALAPTTTAPSSAAASPRT